MVNATNEYLGFSGQGIINQTGGQNNVSNTLQTLFGSMIYNLSGGTLSCSSEMLGTGRFTQNGGSNTCTTLNDGFVSIFNLQPSADTLSISAGTTTASSSAGVGQMLTISSGFGQPATYNAPGELDITGTGSLSSPSITIAPEGVVNLNGGTLSTSAINIQSHTDVFFTYTGVFNWSYWNVEHPGQHDF